LAGSKSEADAENPVIGLLRAWPLARVDRRRAEMGAGMRGVGVMERRCRQRQRIGELERLAMES
jgi:hypothetical protein